MIARTLTVTVVALVVATVTVGDAAADDPLTRPTEPEARERLETGEVFYNQEKWDEAIVEFEKGALLAPDLPVWYFALAQAHRQAGRYERARWYFERFLSSVDEDDPDAEEAVATARKLIEDMNAAQNRPPTEAAPVQVPAVDRERPSRFTTRRKVALGLGGTGLLALGAGVALGLRASGFEDDAAALCPMPSCARADEANALLERGETSALYANVLYGVSAAALLGAAVLWFTGAPDEDEPAHQATVVPRFSDTFAGIDLSMRF